MPGALKLGTALLLILGLTAGGAGAEAGQAPAGAGIVVPAADMKTARSGHTSTLLGDDRVLIAGGMNGNGNYFNSAEIYSPGAKRFFPAAAMSQRRVGHTATLLPGGKVLIAGGYNGDYLDGAELYDSASGRFVPTGRMTMPRSGHVAVLLGNGKVLLAGGVGTGWTFLGSAELYDPSTGTFTSTGGMTAPRESHTATLLENGRVLITGGHMGRREALVVYSSAELYDPARGAFSAAGSMTTARHKHAAAFLPGGLALIVGGSDRRDWQGRYASAEIYDAATGTFSAIGDMNTARFKLDSAVVPLKNGHVLIAGAGEQAEIFDPSTAAFTPVGGRMDAARFFSAATLLRDGQVLITGGYDIHVAATAKAWIYQPQASAGRLAETR